MQFCSKDRWNTAGRLTASLFGARAFAAVLIWSIALGSCFFQAAFAKDIADAGTVYCPLQKRLVPKVEPPAVSLSTTEFCASPRETREFTAKLVSTVAATSISDQNEIDSLFFAYQTIGDNAFQGFSGSPDSPRSPSSVDQTKNAVTASSTDVVPSVPAAVHFETVASFTTASAVLFFDDDVHTSIAQYLSDPQRGPPTI